MDAMLRKALRKYNGLRQQVDNVLLGEEGDVWETELRKFLAKRPCWTPTVTNQAKTQVHSLDMDDIIRVDHSIRPVYPDWVKGVLHPELESIGPAEYSIMPNYSLYLHPKQKEGGWIGGHDLHKHLVETGIIENCAGLADLNEIQKKGVVFFRKHFKGNFIYAWKSVVRSAVRGLGVPCLYERGGRVAQDWNYLVSRWDQDGPALRVA